MSRLFFVAVILVVVGALWSWEMATEHQQFMLLYPTCLMLFAFLLFMLNIKIDVYQVEKLVLVENHQHYIHRYVLKGGRWYVMTDGGEGRDGLYWIKYDDFNPEGNGHYRIEEGKLQYFMV